MLIKSYLVPKQSTTPQDTTVFTATQDHSELPGAVIRGIIARSLAPPGSISAIHQGSGASIGRISLSSGPHQRHSGVRRPPEVLPGESLSWPRASSDLSSAAPPPPPRGDKSGADTAGRGQQWRGGAQGPSRPADLCCSSNSLRSKCGR